MTPQEFNAALDATGVDDTDKLDALAATILSDARQLPLQAADAFNDQRRAERSQKARIVLSALEEHAILPLVNLSPDKLSTEQAAWRSVALARAAIQLRARVVKALDVAMRDKRPVPLRTTRASEEKPLPRRICDEAYLNARQFLNVDEPVGQSLMNSREFLSFPDSKKDAEIAAYLKSRVWKQFVENVGF